MVAYLEKIVDPNVRDRRADQTLPCLVSARRDEQPSVGTSVDDDLARRRVPFRDQVLGRAEEVVQAVLLQEEREHRSLSAAR